MKIFIYSVIAVVGIAIIAGFFVAGSPAAQRQMRFDSQRVSDLQNLQYQIIYYWQAKQKLPVALPEIADATRGVVVPVDPETGDAYGYSVKGPAEFSLCAVFSKPSADSSSAVKAVPTAPPGAPYPAEPSWSHGAGNVCFERRIDTAFYKPLK